MPQLLECSKRYQPEVKQIHSPLLEQRLAPVPQVMVLVNEFGPHSAPNFLDSPLLRVELGDKGAKKSRFTVKANLFLLRLFRTLILFPSAGLIQIHNL